jgi:hypothetical protein
VSAADFQFDAKGVTATVTPYATTYWTCVGTSVITADRQAILVDSDGDGIVRWERGKRKMVNGLFTMIDGTSGAITTRASQNAAEVAPLPFPAKAFLRDGNAFSRFVMNVADDAPQPRSLRVMWVRPGEGAWSAEVGDGINTIDELYATPSELMFDVRKLLPVGSSPAAPSGVQAGDFLVLQNPSADFWIGARVSSDHLAEATGGGVILHVSTAATEDDKKATIQLARIDGTDGVVSVHYETTDGTAKAGVHYQASSGTATFAAGQIFTSIEVPVIEDTVPESTTFTINLSAPSGAALGVTSPLSVYVHDNDGRPFIGLPRVFVPEGDGGAKEASYPMALYHSAPQPVTLEWEMRNAYNDAEVFLTGVLQYAVGEKEKSIKVPYVADDIYGYPKRWNVRITNAVNADFWSGNGILGITEDDPPPTMTVTGTTVNESAGSAIVTVTYSEPFTFSFGGLAFTDDGTATSPSDYEGFPDGFNFDLDEGIATATITIPIHNDTVREGTESFEVLVYILGTQDLFPVTVTILDDDTPVPPRRRTVRH